MRKTSLWQLWSNKLPGQFSKKEAIEALQDRWGLSYNPTYNRIRAGHLPDMVNDLPFLYERFGIGYDMEKGFFFDQTHFDQIQVQKERADAQSFNLAK